jgi:hypothetical protein
MITTNRRELLRLLSVTAAAGLIWDRAFATPVVIAPQHCRTDSAFTAQ